MAEGTRTPDHRDHNPGLYQLSYRHRGRDSLAGAIRNHPGHKPARLLAADFSFVRLGGFEPPTRGLEDREGSERSR